MQLNIFQRARQNSMVFDGYDADTPMKQTAKLRKLITKRGTLEILIPLRCTTNPVRYLKFRNTLKGFSSRTLATRLKELEKVSACGICAGKHHHNAIRYTEQFCL